MNPTDPKRTHLAVVKPDAPAARAAADAARAEQFRALFAEYENLHWTERNGRRAEFAERLEPLLACNGDHERDEVEQCAELGAWQTCEAFARGDSLMPGGVAGQLLLYCHRRAAIESFDRIDRNAHAALVPRRYRDSILAALPWRVGEAHYLLEEGPPRPLLETDAFRAVRAFLTHKPGELKLTSTKRTIALTGRESLLVLGGPNGTGKTVGASWGLSRKGGMFVRAADLCRVSDDADNDPDRIAARKSLLVVDDLGQEHVGGSDFALSVIDRVLGARYDSARPTIVTTNLNEKALEERYGDRLVDRLAEAGAFVPCAGKSLRRKAP